MSNYETTAVNELLRRQHGAAHPRQLMDLGVPSSTITSWVRSGRLERPAGHDHAVVAAGTPATFEARLSAARCEVGPHALVSHAAVLRLVRLWGRSGSPRPEVLVRERSRIEPAWVDVHHTRRLLAGERTEHDGIAATTVARAICDVAGRVRPQTVADLIADAASRGLADEQAMWRSVDCRRRFPGRLAVREALKRFDGEQARFLSKLERRSRTAIIAAGLPAPRVNYPIVERDRCRLLDLAWPECLYALEVDGPVHRLPGRQFADALRIDEIERRGWTLDTVTEAEVESGQHLVLVAARLRERSHPALR